MGKIWSCSQCGTGGRPQGLCSLADDLITDDQMSLCGAHLSSAWRRFC